MIAWSENKRLRFFIRVISIIIIQAFLLYDITWATGGEMGAHKLSPPSVFQQSFPNEKSIEFKNSVLSDMRFLTAAFSIGACLLTDHLPIRYVKPVVEREFRKNIELLNGFDLDSINNEDGVVSVRYSKDGRAYMVKICPKEKIGDLNKTNSHWAVSAKFGIQVAEVDNTLSGGKIALSADRDKVSEEIDILRKVIAEAEKDITNLETEKSGINAKLSSLKQDDADAGRKAELDGLQTKKQQLEEKLRDLQGKKTSILDRVKALKANIEVIDKKIADSLRQQESKRLSTEKSLEQRPAKKLTAPSLMERILPLFRRLVMPLMFSLILLVTGCATSFSARLGPLQIRNDTVVSINKPHEGEKIVDLNARISLGQGQVEEKVAKDQIDLAVGVKAKTGPLNMGIQPSVSIVNLKKGAPPVDLKFNIKSTEEKKLRDLSSLTESTDVKGKVRADVLPVVGDVKSSIGLSDIPKGKPPIEVSAGVSLGAEKIKDSKGEGLRESLKLGGEGEMRLGPLTGELKPSVGLKELKEGDRILDLQGKIYVDKTPALSTKNITEVAFSRGTRHLLAPYINHPVVGAIVKLNDGTQIVYGTEWDLRRFIKDLGFTPIAGTEKREDVGSLGLAPKRVISMDAQTPEGVKTLTYESALELSKKLNNGTTAVYYVETKEVRINPADITNISYSRGNRHIVAPYINHPVVGAIVKLSDGSEIIYGTEKDLIRFAQDLGLKPVTGSEAYEDVGSLGVFPKRIISVEVETPQGAKRITYDTAVEEARRIIETKNVQVVTPPIVVAPEVSLAPQATQPSVNPSQVEMQIKDLLKQSQEDIKKCQEEIKGMLSNIAKLVEEARVDKAKVEVLEAQRLEAKTKLEEAEQEVKIAQDKIRAQAEENRTQAEKLAKAAQEQNEAAFKIKALEEKKQSLEAEASTLKGKLNTAETKPANVVENPKENEKTWLGSHWEAILSMLGILSLGIIILSISIYKSRKRLNQLRHEIAEKEAEKALLAQEIQLAKDALHNVDSQIDQSKATLAEAEKIRLAQEKEIADANLEIVRLKAESDKVKDELARLNEEKAKASQEAEEKVPEPKAEIVKEEPPSVVTPSETAKPLETPPETVIQPETPPQVVPEESKITSAEIDQTIEFLKSLSSKSVQGLLKSQKIDLKGRIRYLHDELGLGIVNGKGRSLLSRTPELLRKQKIFLQNLGLPLTTSNIASSRRGFAKKELKHIIKDPEWNKLTNEEKLSVVSHLYDIYDLRLSWLLRDNDWYQLLHYFNLAGEPINYTPRSIDFIQKYELARFKKTANIQQAKNRLAKIKAVIELFNLGVAKLLCIEKTKEGFEIYKVRPEVYEGKIPYEKQYYPLPEPPSAKTEEARKAEQAAIDALKPEAAKLKIDITNMTSVQAKAAIDSAKQTA
ncbi:MAG: hypothetical protein Q8R38_04220, partial [Candidatus Omnitrophota bacterium]|nr:hypothetical protein [Candidatus Omnitrophota bacterium]